MTLLSDSSDGYAKLNLWAVILAAGQGSRFSSGEGELAKQFIDCAGKPLFWHAALNISGCAPLCGLVFVFPNDPLVERRELLESYAELLRKIDPDNKLGLERRVAIGGRTRRESSLAGVRAVPSSCKAVLIHDAARPNASPELTARVARALLDGHAAVVPGLPVIDTVKRCDTEFFVTSTVDREGLYAIQTPQGFYVEPLLLAHEEAESGSWEATDDAMLMERMGRPVFVVKGDPDNIKITYREDLRMLSGRAGTSFRPGCADWNLGSLFPCAGFGYDVHRYGGERPFVLGGVPIATDIKVAAHSDGDTLLHALVDALLGLAGAGDIGSLFPDTDEAYANMESGIFLAEALCLCREKGIIITHVDVTVIAQVPRLSAHRENIAANLTKLMQLPRHAVNVKATTEEGLGFTGEKKGVKAVAVVSGLRP